METHQLTMNMSKQLEQRYTNKNNGSGVRLLVAVQEMNLAEMS